jgi:hypothetical protein
MTNPNKSQIDEYDLGDLVKELVVKGYSYKDIVNSIQQDKGITISIMSVSRYVRKHTNDNITPKKLYTHKLALQNTSIANSTSLLTNLNAYHNSIRDTVNDCKLSPQEKSKILTYLDLQYINLKRDILDNKVQIMQIFKAINDYDNIFRDTLLEISRGLCLNCRKHVVGEIVEYEKTIKGKE